MPYIKKIELKGFKSFGPKTVTITLDKGFTVITGPNGSGKTNIVDAVLFVLGELSARRLRAENFNKLIFHGSSNAGIEKAKSAKVVIQFDNSDGRIPIDTTTVTVSREVFRNGQSVYRLNGRRNPRGRITEALAMAGISSSGHNVILQGTITRMAEISSHDRRKIIEDLIGIAQYDAEKAEAEEKLREAEISIRTAMGRIDEVQRRVDDLERQRNELLRYTFIQKEVKRFEAMKLFHEISEIQKNVSNLFAKTEEMKRKVEFLGKLREQYMLQRREIEGKWRKLSSEMVEEGSSRVLNIQIQIGDLKSRLTELATRINAGTTSLEGLKKVKENNSQQLEALKKEIEENRKTSLKLKREHVRLLKQILLKQSEHDALANETAQLWANLGENNKAVREIEQKLEGLYQKLAELKSNYTQNKTTIRTLLGRLKELKARKERLTSNLGELQKSLLDLVEVQKEQRKHLKTLQQDLEKKILQREIIEKEIEEAGKVAETAREAVVEFATQRELAETIAAEEKALRNIEELGELGVILGVYGRLRNLIKIEKGYEKAIETAANGWLDAIVVRDFDVAFACTETLKRLKLGRIKIVPLKGLSAHNKPLKLPKMAGVSGAAHAFIKCAREHEPAVAFVFGDTVVTTDDKTAFAISREGYRSVTINGDLYEAGGGLESGYYRAPIDFSTIIPSENAIKTLDEAVRALKEHLSKRENDISSFEEEIDKARVEIARLSEAIVTLESEITRIRKSIKRTKNSIRRVGAHIRTVESRLEKQRTQANLQKTQRQAIQKEIRKLRRQLAILRLKTDPSKIQEKEIRREKLADEIIEMRQKLGTIETEISTLQSKFDNVLKLSYRNIKVQLRKVEKQLSTIEREVQEALHERELLKEEMLKLEKTREELSHTVLTAKKEAKKFMSQIDDIDKKLRRINKEYEEADRLHNQLQLKYQTSLLRLEQYRQRLKELGYKKVLPVSQKQLEEAEVSLKMMRLELERLGAVNQLARSHYAEQASRYKELSLRMNELEREKQAILAFMEEIEQKKLKVFMEAYNKISKNLSKYFSKITGGGKVTLKLENPENPFEGGVDMIVQFPNKPAILVSGASGGERSVAAVAFIFALQEFTPAAFYLLDEIDAHLDAFHVGKLGELLAEESGKSQFIMITLKPEIVNKAERVYGVYERNGVSHVVSVSFKRGA